MIRLLRATPTVCSRCAMASLHSSICPDAPLAPDTPQVSRASHRSMTDSAGGSTAPMRHERVEPACTSTAYACAPAPLQECFALVGIAAGVALLFASQVASDSLAGSSPTLRTGSSGSASLQLSARDAQGSASSPWPRARGPAACSSRRRCSKRRELTRPARGSAAGRADRRRQSLGSARRRARAPQSSATPFRGLGAIVLPAPLARIDRRDDVRRRNDARSSRATSAARRCYSNSRRIADRAAGRRTGRVGAARIRAGTHGSPRRGSLGSSQPQPGAQARVRALQRIAKRCRGGGGSTSSSTSYDERLFAKAAAATQPVHRPLRRDERARRLPLCVQRDAVDALPQRRRLIAELRRDGYAPRAVIGVLLGMRSGSRMPQRARARARR